jgi:hypothetical protein
MSDGAESPFEWKFKLADLGLSHFKDDDLSGEDATTISALGTRAYGLYYSFCCLNVSNRSA